MNPRYFCILHSAGQTKIYLTAVVLQNQAGSLPVQHRTFCHSQMEAMGQKALDLVLITIRFRVSVFNWTLNWNFGFGSCAALTLNQWHTYQQRWIVWRFLYRYVKFMLHGNNGFVHASHSEWYKVFCYTSSGKNFYISLSGGYVFSKV